MRVVLSEKNKKNNLTQGFSLIEIVLVLFLVSFTFTGIYILLAKTAQHEKDNRYAVIASNLAQEGVEMIRNRRDENLLEEIDMDDDLPTAVCYPYWGGSEVNCNDGRISRVEIVNNTYRNCNVNCGTGVTIFSRFCEITAPTGDQTEALKVECTVSWDSPSLKIGRTVTVESYLTNWQENL